MIPLLKNPLNLLYSFRLRSVFYFFSLPSLSKWLVGLRVAVNVVINEGVIISSASDNEENTPPVIDEVDLNNLNNEKILQYIQRLQVTLGQYKAQEEASKMDLERKDEGSETPQGPKQKWPKLRPKGKVESKDDLDETPKRVEWKLVRAV